jgi:hypothetical protein
MRTTMEQMSLIFPANPQDIAMRTVFSVLLERPTAGGQQHNMGPITFGYGNYGVLATIIRATAFRQTLALVCAA